MLLFGNDFDEEVELLGADDDGAVSGALLSLTLVTTERGWVFELRPGAQCAIREFLPVDSCVFAIQMPVPTVEAPTATARGRVVMVLIKKE
jgi:hypothetical protein